MQSVYIGIAGIFGVLARYYTSLGITRLLGTEFPYATVLINIVGSFAIGLFYVLGFEKNALNEFLRAAVIIGFLGGFTTFSSFSLETVRLVEGGQWGFALANVIGSVALCLIGTFLGMKLGRVF